MVIDTSALIAILLNEPDAGDLRAAIGRDQTRLISTATVLEAHMVACGRIGETGPVELDLLLQAIEAAIVPFDAAQMRMSREAFHQFGKGRHPAALNFGDCFSYALAAATGEPLLFKGVDFSRTDIAAAA